MKRSFLFLLISVAAIFVQASSAAVLYDRSNLQTGTGNGFMGANTSAIATGSTVFGFGENGTGSTQVILADQFTLGLNSTISSIAFTGYSTSTYPFPPTSPFTAATLNIWNAQPGTAGAAVLFTSNTLSMTAWTGLYRVTQTTLTNAQRPVFSLTMAFPNVALVAGTYWASWTITGVGAPGTASSVFDPPVMNSDGTMPTGTSIQSLDGGATWAPTVDTGSSIQVSVPLTVNGTAVPEPSTTALFFLCGAAFAFAALRFRRRI
jgi:hypothetical protein